MRIVLRVVFMIVRSLLARRRSQIEGVGQGLYYAAAPTDEETQYCKTCFGPVVPIGIILIPMSGYDRTAWVTK